MSAERLFLQATPAEWKAGFVKFLWRVVTLAALAAPLMMATWAHSADLVIPALVHGGLQYGDYWSTTTSRGIEANPVVRGVGLKPAKVGVFVLTYGTDIIIQKKTNKKKKWLVWVYRGIIGVGYGFAIRHNRSVR